MRSSVKLLLEAGGVTADDEMTRNAAAGAAKSCAFLPLALSIAGGMLQEHADDWTEQLVPLLESDHRAELRKRSTSDFEEDAPTAEDRVSIHHATTHHAIIISP